MHWQITNRNASHSTPTVHLAVGHVKSQFMKLNCGTGLTDLQMFMESSRERRCPPSPKQRDG